jgi:hypothetical protein
MADAKIGKGTTSDEQKARPTNDGTEDVLVVDTNDGVDIVIDTSEGVDIVLSERPTRQNKTRVVNCGSKTVSSPKII